MSAVLNLEAAVEASMRASPDRWDGSSVHASDLAVAIEDDGDRKCGRQLWLRTHGADERERTPGEMLMLRHGNRIHEDMEELIRESLPDGWSVVGVERSVEIHGVTGRYDFKLRGPDGETVIVDIKTVRGNWFRYANTERPANVMQIRTYLEAEDADYGLLLYVDREGQNGCTQFYVERDDAEVARAAQVAHEIVSLPMAPVVMPPKVKVRENKGPDAIYAELPWQCRYCSYLDVSCDGALAPADRHDGVVGHVTRYGFKSCVPLSDAAEAAICFKLEADPVEEVA